MDYEKVHEKTGIPIEEIKRMSWSEIERALDIKIVEPPYEIKQRIRNHWAREYRWITSEEIKKLKEEADEIIKKFL